MTTGWRAFQTAIGAVPARPRPRTATPGSPWVAFRQAVGALPLKSGGGAAGWGALQEAIGAVPVLRSERTPRVGIVDVAAVEFCADLIHFGWSSVVPYFAPEETGKNEMHGISTQERRPRPQLMEKTNFKASTIDIPRLASA